MTATALDEVMRLEILPMAIQVKQAITRTDSQHAAPLATLGVETRRCRSMVLPIRSRSTSNVRLTLPLDVFREHSARVNLATKSAPAPRVSMKRRRRLGILQPDKS